MAPWKPLGAPWPPAGLLERSGKPFGRLLEAFGPQKTKLGSALGRPKGTKETGFALPESHMNAQKEPRRVLKLVPKVNQAENWETIKIVDSTSDFLDF